MNGAKRGLLRRIAEYFTFVEPEAGAAARQQGTGGGTEAGQGEFNPAATEREFLQLYTNLAGEINSHLEYSAEMTRSMGNSSPVVKPFDLDEYAAQIEEFFRRHGVWQSGEGTAGKGSASTLMSDLLLLTVLPPNTWRIELSRELRERLFGRAVKRCARETGYGVSQLVKGLYERVKFGGETFYDRSREEMLEALRDAAVRLDIELRSAEQEMGRRHLQQQEQEARRTNEESARIPPYIFEAVGVRSARELEKLMQRTLGIDGVLSLLILLALGVLILLQPDLPANVAAALAEQSGSGVEPAVFSIVFSAFAIFLLLWSVVRAFRFGSALQRRKLFLRLIAKADGMALAEREELRAYAAKRFGIKKRLF